MQYKLTCQMFISNMIFKKVFPTSKILIIIYYNQLTWNIYITSCYGVQIMIFIIYKLLGNND